MHTGRDSYIQSYRASHTYIQAHGKAQIHTNIQACRQAGTHTYIQRESNWGATRQQRASYTRGGHCTNINIQQHRISTGHTTSKSYIHKSLCIYIYRPTDIHTVRHPPYRQVYIHTYTDIQAKHTGTQAHIQAIHTCMAHIHT